MLRLYDASSQRSVPRSVTRSVASTVTGQLADTPTRGLPTRGVDDSRTGQLAAAIGDFECLVFLFGGICETASCPVTAATIASCKHRVNVKVRHCRWFHVTSADSSMIRSRHVGQPSVFACLLFKAWCTRSGVLNYGRPA